MELPTSNKESKFGKRVHIKKGYYPGKLLSVEERKDQDGNAFIGKWGKQLLMEFGIYNSDENGKPTDIMTVPMGEGSGTQDVCLTKFVYHMYENKKAKEGEPKFSTAITPNSAITGIFKALGWNFDGTQPLKTDDYVGKWVELNVDDYEAESDGEKYKASTIKDISKWEGEKAPAATPAAPPAPNPAEPKEGDSEEAKSIKTKMESLKGLKDDGALTQKGYDDAIEQLNKKLVELKK